MTRELKRAYEAVYSTPNGKVVIDDILKRLNYNQPIHTSDTAALHGRAMLHDIGLGIARFINPNKRKDNE